MASLFTFSINKKNVAQIIYKQWITSLGRFPVSFDLIADMFWSAIDW